MPPVVEGDDAPPRLGQGLYPLRENPIYRMGRGKPMNEKNRLAAIARRRPPLHKSPADPMVQEFEHPWPPFRGTFPASPAHICLHRTRSFAGHGGEFGDVALSC